MSTDTTPLVELRDLKFGYNDRLILDGVSLRVPRGKVTALMGASGGGKTTVLRLIGGQYRAQSGSLTFDGQEVGALNPTELYAVRRRMGMLFQNGALLTDLSVFENVAFPVREHARLPERVLRQLVLTKLQAVGLRGAAELMPAQLSGGMARRVALARAIVMDPELLIYDEPFVGLNPISMGVIVRLIQRINRALGITTIVVSHDVAELAALADHSYLLSGGKVVAAGTPAELAASAQHAVRQFMAGEADGPVAFHYPADDYRAQLLGGRR